jgi:threonine dehydrogenase-like Zn-dependent dehydrogenase
MKVTRGKRRMKFMKALIISGTRKAEVAEVPEVEREPGDVLLKINYISLCGTDLNSFRGRNPSVTYPIDPMISAVVGIEKAPAILHCWDAEPEQFTKILIEMP